MFVDGGDEALVCWENRELLVLWPHRSKLRGDDVDLHLGDALKADLWVVDCGCPLVVTGGIPRHVIGVGAAPQRGVVNDAKPSLMGRPPRVSGARLGGIASALLRE